MNNSKEKIIFIILPKNDSRFKNDSSPIKGAIALANYLSKFITVKIIFLDNSKITSPIDKKIKVHKVKGNFLFKFFYLKKMFIKYRKFKICTLSFCLSADLINILIKPYVTSVSTSVRGDLVKSYYSNYGTIGFFVAKFHYFLISRFDKIFSMHRQMYVQIKSLTNRKSLIAGNFIDEKFHSRFFKKKKEFFNKIIYMGNLDKNKNPLLLIRGFIKLIKTHPKVELIILGDGPLKSKILEIKKKNNLKNLKILGFIKNPIKYLINSDLLVCTSISEGISRSVLEALFYGVPVVTSNVNASRDLIKNYVNGFVFNNENIFLSNFKKVLIWSSNLSKERKCLLPSNFRQKNVSNIYLKNLIH